MGLGITSLGIVGKLVLPKATCEATKKLPVGVEDFVLRSLRSYLSLPGPPESSRSQSPV
jgi:hypothetical protein